MTLEIEKATEIGFCFGVKRAVDIMQRVACEHRGIETLGALVHNQPVLNKLERLGVRIAKSVDDVKGSTLVISAHGINSELEEEIQARGIKIIDTTCPFVRRAQVVARRLAESGFFVIVYGDSEHSEVQGVLSWARNKGMAILDVEPLVKLEQLPRRIGVLSQTTQIPSNFIQFTKELVDLTFTRDSELRIIDTICHDIRNRQATALELANKMDLMLVIGGHNSANTNRLVELCSTATKTYLVETADEINPSWLQGKEHIGITAGASTAEQTINEVVAKLESLAQLQV